MNATIAQTLTTHQAFVGHVHAFAAKAQAALPSANGRVARAVEIVLAGGVEDDGAGRYAVASQGNFPEHWYTVGGNMCTCPDFTHRSTDDAQMVCKHVIASWLYRRSVTQIEQEEQMTEDAQEILPTVAQAATTTADVSPVGPAETHAPVSLPEAPASINAFIMVAGHKCQITLRDTDETRLMQRMVALLADYAPVQGK